MMNLFPWFDTIKINETVLATMAKFFSIFSISKKLNFKTLMFFWPAPRNDDNDDMEEKKFCLSSNQFLDKQNFIFFYKNPLSMNQECPGNSLMCCCSDEFYFFYHTLILNFVERKNKDGFHSIELKGISPLSEKKNIILIKKMLL